VQYAFVLGRRTNALRFIVGSDGFPRLFERSRADDYRAAKNGCTAAIAKRYQQNQIARVVLSSVDFGRRET